MLRQFAKLGAVSELNVNKIRVVHTPWMTLLMVYGIAGKRGKVVVENYA